MKESSADETRSVLNSFSGFYGNFPRTCSTSTTSWLPRSPRSHLTQSRINVSSRIQFIRNAVVSVARASWIYADDVTRKVLKTGAPDAYEWGKHAPRFRSGHSNYSRRAKQLFDKHTQSQGSRCYLAAGAR